MTGEMSPEILANISSDYTKEARKGLVSPILFPRTEVQEATGKFPLFDRADLLYVPDAKLAKKKDKAVEVEQTHSFQAFACEQYALKESIANSQIEKAKGPFPRVIGRTVEQLVVKLELAQENRVATTVKALSGNNATTLAGTGNAEANKWDNAGSPGGKPVSVIMETLDNMTIRGNTLVIPRSVWQKLQYHTDVTGKLPGTMYQTLTVEALKAIFTVENVVIASGQIKTTKNGNIDVIWGNNVVCAYVDNTGDPDQPTAGHTLINEYAEGGVDGWIARSWQDEAIGVTGGTWFQVGHEVDELLVAKDLIHVIKDVI